MHRNLVSKILIYGAWAILGIILAGGAFAQISAQESSVNTNPGAYGADLTSQEPNQISAQSGEVVDVMLEFENIGDATWRHAEQGEIRIGTSLPRDDESSQYQHDSWLTSNRVATFEEEEVEPGETATFEFKIVIPNDEGEYWEQFELVAEDVGWIQDSEFRLNVNIEPTIFEYAWVSQSPPLEMVAGDKETVWVELENTGNVTWKPEDVGAIKLGTGEPRDRASDFATEDWLNDNRADVLDEEVEPGETARFEFEIRAPKSPGVHKEYFNLVAEGVQWLPSIGLYWEFEVEPAIYEYEVVSETSDLTIVPGEEREVTVEVRNTGNVPWEAGGDKPVKLGTSSPLDRDSRFESNDWLSSNRVAKFPDTVNPNETATLEFTLSASEDVPIGEYQESFQLVAESFAWMEGQQITWPVRVTKEFVAQDPIRVGLTPIESPIVVTGTNGFAVRIGEEEELLRRVDSGTSLTLSESGDEYDLQFSDGESYERSGRVELLPLDQGIMQLNGDGISSEFDKYKGIIRIAQSSLSGRHWVVNVLDVDDYMKGIAEVSSTWPEEAVKAQVVSARTYALRLRESPVADIFDLYDDTRSQVYYGYAREERTPDQVEAVEETESIVMKYDGELIRSYYFSDSGGATANVENVWGGGDPAQAIPYLKHKDDPYAKPIEWETTLEQSYVLDRFEDEISISGRVTENVVDMEVTSTYPSGRIEEVVLTTSGGREISVSGQRFDFLTHNTRVKSRLFSEIQKQGADNKPDFVIEGKGNGHGVGLSQWSAKNMADEGKTYEEILTFFYTGIDVEEID